MKIGTAAHHTPLGGLAVRRSPQDPFAAVVLLHGGRADDLRPPPLLNLPALRMRAFSAAVTRALRGRAVLIAELRYRHRGWNGVRADAAQDALGALARIRACHGDIPVVLIGHSMGGRAALRAAAHPSVRGVIALAPWCPPGEPVDHLAGRELYLLHDEKDRITSARQSWDFVRLACAAGAVARGIPMPAGRHTMLRGGGLWHRRTAEIVAGMLSRR
ncbi:alpha/beta fold hydrolase [Streptomyces sp. NPDC001586]|uniref:alpha/beta fold hydrolase n=1 Tax=unclassified Streptomyces TaxID=2593676 RepID=UPI003316A373